MYEIIKYLVKRNKTLSLEELIEKTGLKRDEVMRYIEYLVAMGEISYLNLNQHSSLCNDCPFKTKCGRGKV
jgi:DNA-binding IclR family transcriptional regulator